MFRSRGSPHAVARRHIAAKAWAGRGRNMQWTWVKPFGASREPWYISSMAKAFTGTSSGRRRLVTRSSTARSAASGTFSWVDPPTA